MHKKPLLMIGTAFAGSLALISVLTIDSTSAAGNKDPGIIGGEVVFKGTPPVRPILDRSADPFCAKTTARKEAVVVTRGKLRDVHVRIKSGTAGKHKAPKRHVSIDQTNCSYHPRVVGVMQGQKLSIGNSDPTFHNVHGKKGTRTAFNLGHPQSAPPILRDPGKAGEVLKLGCDVHAWMQAFAVVTDHPYFAVTAKDGRFRLPNVPPGIYILEAWHPTLGLKTATIRVRPGATTNTKFTFK